MHSPNRRESEYSYRAGLLLGPERFLTEWRENPNKLFTIAGLRRGRGEPIELSGLSGIITMKDCRRLPRAAVRYERRQTGLTILEVLMVFGILTLLVGLILPAIEQTRESSRRVQCASHLRQIGEALHSHHSQFEQLPAGWSPAPVGRLGPAWGKVLLPSLGLPAIDGATLTAGSGGVVSVTDLYIPLFICPSDVVPATIEIYQESGHHVAVYGQASVLVGRYPAASYLGVFGTLDPDFEPLPDGDGCFFENSRVRLDNLTRGTSQTLLVGERTARRLPSTWLGVDPRGEEASSRVVGLCATGPNRADADESEFDSRHTGFANFVWADGHVTAVADGIDSAIYRQMARRAQAAD
jgi:prepilin-type processing-associated H-X9-DG protein